MLKLRKKRLPENQRVQIKKDGRIIMPIVDATLQSNLFEPDVEHLPPEERATGDPLLKYEVE